ncbi:site-specific integrase [Polynucleobacter sp. Ross1-W9]|uniref:site-specific integrase n=1 Tax=Polynucleobacter parvulilacunae TaxID=1855631 RepID=UPI001C0C54FC|nr:site-specific integrase [Polynucleobacter parvulilacunae]MBU3557176.1 site-specific integrase [Polynucleobacter parvulilacunae]
MINIDSLDLTFPKIVYGEREIPWDLRVLLYQGASAENQKNVFNKIAAERFGSPIQARIELVQHIHDEMNALLIGGKAQLTLKAIFNHFREFFAWADKQDIELKFVSVATTYRQWADHLFFLTRVKRITEETAYSKAVKVSRVLTAILGKTQQLISMTNLLPPSKRKNTDATDKQDLGSLLKFCDLLMDIANGLNISDIFGQLPVKIKLRNGLEWCEWSGLIDVCKVKSQLPDFKGSDWDRKIVAAKRSAWEKDHSIRTRYPLINRRIEAELLIFITQTGMNLSQAYQLKMVSACYTSSIDGYKVSAYKRRRKGDISFEIFSAYRPHFEKYLTWRKEIFKDTNDLLFPFIRLGSPLSKAPAFDRIRDICKAVNTPYHGPRELRKSRINWMLRISRDPDLTAEQAQHTKRTLLEIYEKPSHQVSKVEIIQFWRMADPTLQQAQVGMSPAPGLCDGIPLPISKLSTETPKPDCINPGGCLFCQHHRDIDSQDYIWSVASMRHLNVLILAGFPPIKKNKIDMGSQVEMVLEILSAKLKWFQSSNEKRKKWVIEALDRCREGDFHQHWSYLIESVATKYE